MLTGECENMHECVLYILRLWCLQRWFGDGAGDFQQHEQTLQCAVRGIWHIFVISCAEAQGCCLVQLFNVCLDSFEELVKQDQTAAISEVSLNTALSQTAAVCLRIAAVVVQTLLESYIASNSIHFDYFPNSFQKFVADLTVVSTMVSAKFETSNLSP